MTNLKLLIALLLFCLPLQSTIAFESIGEVTINGETIRPVLYRGYSQHYMTNINRCPPNSDTYLRDQVIRAALIVFDARKKGLAIAQYRQEEMDKFQRELEYQGPDGNANEINKAELLKFFAEAGAYTHHYTVVVTREEILAEYKRLIKIKDPRFTDVVIVRQTPLEFSKKGEADRAMKMLQNGSSVKELEDAFENEHFSPHRALYWSPITEIYGDFGDGKELETGSVVKVDEYRLVYFDEVKLRSRLRPFTAYRHKKNFVYDKVKLDLAMVRHLERDKALWEAADVREDGVSIEMAGEYPACS